jgi:hypothetical protein
MRHMSSESEAGKNLKIALRAAQLEAGVSWDILEKPTTIPHMSHSWIKALMDFLAPHGIQIKQCNDTKWESYVIQSEGDEFIMDKVLSSNRFSDQDKADINRARLFYKALTVSDIANAEGTKVDEVYFSLDSPSPNISKWKWPNQPSITSKQRNLWERAIRTLFVRHVKLRQRLGRWTQPTHRRHAWYFCPAKQELMKWGVNEDGKIQFEIFQKRPVGSGFEKVPSETKLATETTTRIFFPADVTEQTTSFTIRHRDHVLPPEMPPATSLLEFVDRLPKQQRRLLTGLKMVHEHAVYWIRRQWEGEGLLVSATDGSAPADGTFGWVLALPDGTALVECNGPADGSPDQMSSGQEKRQVYCL